MKSLNEQKYHQMIDSAIIWVTLGTLFIIPIIFNYFHIFSIFVELKLVTLHFGAGLISILWLWKFLIYREALLGILKQNLGGVLRPSIDNNPTNWALIGASVWFIALIISTILSPISSVSFFGAEDNRSGYSLYNYISLFVIFLSIAFRFRSIASLKLLVYTLISSGTVVAAYGIAQHFQWDPIGGNIGLNRVQASFGNSLDFGAYLVMTIPATLALALLTNKHKYSWTYWSILPVGLQLAGLWFSGSRGPYIATSTAVLAFFVIAIVIGHTKSIIRPTLVLIAAGLIAAVIIILPSPRDDIGLQRLSSIENQITSSITTSNEVSGGLIGRFNIWDSTFELAEKWHVPAQESFVFTLLRPMFGLGPDMFIYSFPIVQKPRIGLQVVDHTHNYELQILMEQGFIGLTGFLIFTGCLIISILAIVRRLRSTDQQLSITAFLVLGLSPSIIGKIIEIQTGVARISDLTMMFALFGAIIALYKITNRQETFNNTDQVEVRITRMRKLMSKPSHSGFLISRFLVFITVAIVIISTFIQWDMRRLAASRSHAIGLSATSKLDQVQAWARAQSQAPERPSFTNDLFTEYFQAAMYHHDRGEKHEAIQLMLVAHELLLQFEYHDPFKRDIQMNLLQSEVALIQWGQLQYTQSAVDRAEKIISLFPSYPSFISVVATNMTLIEMHQLAIEYSDRVIDTEKETQAWSKAWYAKGRALYQLGYIEEAIKILNTATEKRPGAEGSIFAHKLLAQIHSKNGMAEDLTLWKFHKLEGDKKVTVQE